MVTAMVGTSDPAGGTIQYGNRLGKSASYRVYAKYRNQGSMPGLGATDGADAWHLLTGGFRADEGFSAIFPRNTWNWSSPKAFYCQMQT
jgi:hypothetical protein